MRRREFLAASAAAVVGSTVPWTAAADGKGVTAGGRHLIEVRTYHFASPERQRAYEEFLTKAGVAAMNRAGAGPVGVFGVRAADNPKLKLDQDPSELWVVLPHESAEAYLAFESRLAADREYQTAGAGILDLVKADAAYTVYESMLLLAFEGMPRLVAPQAKAAGRVLELRTYQSPNQERARNKVEMFNRGEIAIFARVGMPPVFFGGAVAGADLPQLTYMVCHESMESAPEHWKAFGGDTEWKAMKDRPEYRDNVSRIVNRFLRPAGGSQI